MELIEEVARLRTENELLRAELVQQIAVRDELDKDDDELYEENLRLRNEIAELRDKATHSLGASFAIGEVLVNLALVAAIILAVYLLA